MTESTEIVTEIATKNGLETLLLVKALKMVRENEEKCGCESGVEAVDELLAQTEQTTAYVVMVEESEEQA